nr:MAG TPA: hypothetical protein [Caudoviricetes sp.]
MNLISRLLIIFIKDFPAIQTVFAIALLLKRAKKYPGHKP